MSASVTAALHAKNFERLLSDFFLSGMATVTQDSLVYNRENQRSRHEDGCY